MTKPKLSLIIPVYNEEGNIGKLIKESFSVIPEKILGEIIVVDDCSKDNSSLEIKKLKKIFDNLRYLKHKMNYGQSASLHSGVLAAKFPVIAQMDGDGQNDPRDIERLYECLEMEQKAKKNKNRIALVGGLRAKRKDTGSKRLASQAANKIRNQILRDGCPDTGCGIKVYWRSVFLQLPFFSSMHRYLPALFQTYNYKCKYMPVNDRPRLIGVSKYNNFRRALIGLRDLVGVSWLRKRTIMAEYREE